ncbi:MAG: phosphohydrolase [Candidatus Hydromicrobium americanum]|nr:MAG: phosphohydrolase [Candidatus Hydromicrobium americanum]
MNFINSFTLTGKQKEYLKDLTEKIKSIMSSSLYQHSINTLEYASTIAQKYLSDIEFFDLGVACILHDYGKVFNYEELVKIAKENELEVGSFELNSPLLLHSFVGDYLVLRDFNVSSSKILKAIKFHAIGYCNMNLADKILFIADKVEKSRNYNGVKKLRNLALKNINLCLLEVYKNNIIYIIKRNRFLHPDTVKIWNNICGGV